MIGAKDHIIKVNFKTEQKINMNDRFETNKKMKVELFDNNKFLKWLRYQEPNYLETLSVC